MQLVLTEKPSVARDLARVLRVTTRRDGWFEGADLVITWCLGHLVELQEPAHYDERWRRWSLDTLPMVPDAFSLRPREGAGAQWKVVRRLLREPRFDELINACDAGREGELIFRYAVEAAGCTLPVRRLWLASLTNTAIEAAWRDLRPGSRYDALADAARCRSEADWLVGLNATRAMTCVARGAGSDRLLSVGRVQTPTLAMIVARDREIARFRPEPFWRVVATFTAGDATWQGAWFRQGGKDEREDGQTPPAERLPDQAAADGIAAAARGERGLVERSSRKAVSEKPPLLYDLTSLQRRANQRYGLPADRSLALAQSLYEKKLITYPRTDARFLTPDQVPGLVDVLTGLATVPVYAPFARALLAAPLRPGKRVVNADEVGDHPAILPTGRVPPARLTLDEKRVFDLVARRLMAALSPPAVFERTELIVAVHTERAVPTGVVVPLRFRARGRVCRSEGWRAVDPPPRQKDVDLPDVAKGAEALAQPVEVADGHTRPPRPFNDASLLYAMETAGRALDDEELARAMRGAGLGTPATRAAILQTLIRRGFVVRQVKALVATDQGCALIDAVPADDLKSAELTGRWEARLTAIAGGAETREAFMGDVVGHVRQLVATLAAADPPPPEVLQGKSLGRCPRCGGDVHRARSAYRCGGARCAFHLPSLVAGRELSPRMVTHLLRSGRCKPVKGFRNRQGKPFTAGLELDAEGAVVFWFPRGPRRKPPNPVGMPCPECGRGKLIKGKAAWGCNRWRAGCGFTFSFERNGRPLSDAEAVALLGART